MSAFNLGCDSRTAIRIRKSLNKTLPTSSPHQPMQGGTTTGDYNNLLWGLIIMCAALNPGTPTSGPTYQRGHQNQSIPTSGPTYQKEQTKPKGQLSRPLGMVGHGTVGVITWLQLSPSNQGLNYLPSMRKKFPPTKRESLQQIGTFSWANLGQAHTLVTIAVDVWSKQQDLFQL